MTEPAARPRRTRPTPPAAPAARWQCAAPIQARGRDTVERLAGAAEELLLEAPFEEIGVLDIARRAGRPVGSFYARFPSKEALLPFLYRRYHESLEPMFASRLARVDWKAVGFDQAVSELVGLLIRMFLARPQLIRALALFARQRPEALPDDVVERRRRLMDRLARTLLVHRPRITHPDPEAAVRFGLFFTMSTARERLLFPEAPNARVTPAGRKALHAELTRALASYLTAGAPR